jgi:hypothetical protein
MLRASVAESIAVCSGGGFLECDFFRSVTMTNKTLVLGLLLACLANLICLAGYW